MPLDVLRSTLHAHYTEGISRYSFFLFVIGIVTCKCSTWTRNSLPFVHTVRRLNFSLKIIILSPEGLCFSRYWVQNCSSRFGRQVPIFVPILRQIAVQKVEWRLWEGRVWWQNRLSLWFLDRGLSKWRPIPRPSTWPSKLDRVYVYFIIIKNVFRFLHKNISNIT